MAPMKHQLALPVFLFSVVFWASAANLEGLFISNLNNACFACLCNVMSLCDMTRRCTDGYCGPFFIAKVYWSDAGKVTLPDDDPTRNKAWEDCACNYDCAKRIIAGYIQKYGRGRVKREGLRIVYIASEASK